MVVLGVNAFHGDVAAALLVDGRVMAAVEEERFNRIKHTAGFPDEAIHACLTMARIRPADVDLFAVSRAPRAHLWRKVLFAARYRPDSRLIADRARNLRAVDRVDARLAGVLGLPVAHVKRRLRHIEHHPAHLASAFFVSPFDRAAVCAIDGFGDFVSTSFAEGRGTRLRLDRYTYFPHSLGLFYLAVTQFLGFPHFGDEFKVMGLAPYGERSMIDALGQLVRVDTDGGVHLDLRYFRHWRTGGELTWDAGAPRIGRVFEDRLADLLGPPRRPDEPLTPRHEALAASLQAVYEQRAFEILRALHRRIPSDQLCLAGGCAMNSVANGKIREQTPFREIYVQPASGDNGTALGAALAAWHDAGGARRAVMTHGYWGPEFSATQIAAALTAREDELRARASVERLDDDDALCEWGASAIRDGLVLGWFQGRMEWGSRALGNRSILADPRRADMRDIINSRIKFREKFRPFAPSVAIEALDDYFVGAVPDPFMVQVYPVRPDKRAIIPAVTHVDGSGRLQTVSGDTNPLYWRLITAFGRMTGVPVVLNTSFNENEPIVHRPEEALDCFLRTDMDALAMGPFVLRKR